jgi:hypothetical protein
VGVIVRIIVTLLLVGFATAPSLATFEQVPAPRIVEIPIERVLGNLTGNGKMLPTAELQRAIGRVHLLAYLRGVVTLPVLRDKPSEVAEGSIGDCGQLDPLPF